MVNNKRIHALVIHDVTIHAVMHQRFRSISRKLPHVLSNIVGIYPIIGQAMLFVDNAANVTNGINTTLLSYARTSRLVIYNRVHKCGSNTLKIYVKHLAQRNHFRMQSSSTYHQRRMSVLKQVMCDNGYKHSTLLI